MPLEGLIEVILYVADMQQAVSFYRDKLGLRIAFPQCADYSSEYWVVFDTGRCKLCLHGGGDGDRGESAPKIVFQVANVRATREDLAACGIELSEPRSPAAGVWVCDASDPAGNRFSIESVAS